MRRAVLFDVGGPLDTEILYERLIDRDIRTAFAAAGAAVEPRRYAAACRYAVAAFAPDAYQAIIWRLAGDDRALAESVYAAVRAGAEERHRRRGGLEVRPGIAPLLERLTQRGVALGLAANQPTSALARLDAAGLGGFFRYREVTGTHGLRKPDVRVFLHACAALELPPAACVMVGDRIDNDIVPARALGMRAIRFVTGRHARQRPRSWLEAPDAEVHDVEELRAVLEGW